MVTTITQIEAALNRDSRSAREGFLTTYEYATHLRQFIDTTQSAALVTLAGVHTLAVDFGQSLLNAKIVSDQRLAALVSDRRQVIEDLPMITLLDQTDEEILCSDDQPMLSQDCRDEVRRRGVRFTYDLLLKLSPGTLILWRG